MIKKAFLNILILGWFGLLPAHALAGDFPVVTGDRVWDAFTEIKKRWMFQLFDLVVSTRPDLKEAAELALEWRIKEMDYDNKRFQYLLKYHSQLIVRDEGLRAFADLDWYPSYTKDFNRLDPSFGPDGSHYRRDQKGGRAYRHGHLHQLQCLLPGLPFPGHRLIRNS